MKLNPHSILTQRVFRSMQAEKASKNFVVSQSKSINQDPTLQSDLKGIMQQRPYAREKLPIKVIIREKRLTYEERQNNELNTIDQISQTSLSYKAKKNYQNKIISFLLKEKVLNFDYFFNYKEENELFYKTVFRNLNKELLSGFNQTVVFSGFENSGKLQNVFGHLRDPGFLIFCFRDLFSQLFDRENSDDYTIKFSFINYSYVTNQFYDLLVSGKQGLEYYEDDINEKYFLGKCEIIINNMKTALKLIKIAMLNLMDYQQGLSGQDNLKNSNIFIQVKVELNEQNLNQDFTISNLRIIKMGQDIRDPYYDFSTNETHESVVPQQFNNLIKIISEMNYKNKKNPNHENKQNKFIEYIKDFIQGNSMVYMIFCVNSLSRYHYETANTLRMACYAKNIATNPSKITFSFLQLRNQNNEIVSDLKQTFRMWYTEFDTKTNEWQKKKRMVTILRNIIEMDKDLDVLLSSYDMHTAIISNLNSMFVKILGYECNLYSKSVTSEDIQEFYVAKLQTHIVEDMKQDLNKSLNTVNHNLNELNYVKFNMINQLKIFTALCKTWDSYKTNKTNDLSQFDQEKFEKIGKLFKKLIDIIDFSASINQYKATQIHSDIEGIFKDTSEKYIEMQELGLFDEHEAHRESYSPKTSLIKGNLMIDAQQVVENSLDDDFSLNNEGEEVKKAVHQLEKIKERHIFINNIRINAGQHSIKNIKKENQIKFLRSNFKTQFWDDHSEFDEEIVSALFKNEKLSLESKLPIYSGASMTTSRMVNKNQHNDTFRTHRKNQSMKILKLPMQQDMLSFKLPKLETTTNDQYKKFYTTMN